MMSAPPPDLKRTKRVRDASEELTLEEHIAVKRASFVKAREEVPELLRRATELRTRAYAMTARYQRRMVGDMERQADELEREAKVRESMVREHRFESTVVTYLRTYHERVHDGSVCTARKSDTVQAFVRHTDLTKSRRASILDEYLTEMNKAPPKVAMSARDECPRCDRKNKLLLCSAKSIMNCPECGYSVSYLDATSTSTSFDDIVEFSQYSYKRVTHYMMWLSLVQGKEAHRVPDDILQQVMADLYERYHITDKKDITQKHVRESLRKLRLRKAYDHVTQITSRISGVRPPRIPPETEELLKNMFLQMQPAFAKHAPKSRTNFLSYSYVLYRSFQILNLPHMCQNLSLLKGRDKLEANDTIFRKMCCTLGWPIFDLPPESARL